MLDGASLRSPSGPAVASLFHRALAAVFLIAWASLGSQISLLVGSRGLLPLGDFVAAARAEGTLSLSAFPSLLTLAPGDHFLVGGVVAGLVLSLVGLAGWRPRTCAAVQTFWYLGYATACRSFLGFQWDNLLLECGLLATFLPAGRPAPWAHLLFRALLFKLYFESGLAKWQSPLHDWRDGSAMTFYYETAPLPTALAWYAHHLPRGWHVFESYATLAIELLLPFAIFGPRRARLSAAAAFTLFQVINAATASYGFFCYLTGTLHLFLLDDLDVIAMRQRIGHRLDGWWVRAWRRQSPSVTETPPQVASEPAPPGAERRGRSPGRRIVAGIGLGAWAVVSLIEAWFHFGDPAAGLAPALVPVLEWSQTFRVVNAYHLFAAVTRERIEPEIQIQSLADGAFTPFHLHYKPGEPLQRPVFVAPHQPRVDFLLWFYGLGYQGRRQPAYVAELLARLCEEPAAVAPLFESALPTAPTAVRVAFWDYRFTSAAERRATGAWWTRRAVGSTEPIVCAPVPTSALTPRSPPGPHFPPRPARLRGTCAGRAADRRPGSPTARRGAGDSTGSGGRSSDACHEPAA